MSTSTATAIRPIITLPIPRSTIAQSNPTPNPRQNQPTALPSALARTGFQFARPGEPSIPQDQWINQARTSNDPVLKSQYQALVTLAGGRTDTPAIKQVMERIYAQQTAVTASDRQSAERNMVDQLMTGLRGLDPFTGVETLAAKGIASLANSPAFAGTEWGQRLSVLSQGVGTVGAFNDGLREGAFEGGKAMVTGIASLAGNILQYGADHSALGIGGDMLRSVTGRMPAFLEAITPSMARGQSEDAAIRAMATNAANYVMTRTPGEVANDIGGAMNGAWESLRADHAAAAAQGPQAEARWFGNVTGRIGFEIAATFIPVAGIAGKISGGARAADAGADLMRASDRVADGVRAGQRAEQAEDVGGIASRFVRYMGDGPLFRGDRRAPAEIFRDGFRPKGGTDDLAKYVADHVDSNFVSTSTSLDAIKKPYYTGGPGGWVYDIDPSLIKSPAIDVNRSLGKHSMDFEAEIAIHGGVPKEAIRSARQVLEDGSLGMKVRNPSYVGAN